VRIAGDMQPLHARRVASDEGYRALRHAEMLRHQQDQRGVRRTVDGGNREPGGEVVGGAGCEGIAAAAGRDADGEDQPVGDRPPGLSRCRVSMWW